MKYFAIPLFLTVLIMSGCEEKEEVPVYVHPAFSFTYQELEEIVSDQPGPVQAAVSKRPEYFLELLGEVLQLPEYATILVDKNHALPGDYVPQRLTVLHDYGIAVSRTSHMVLEDIMPDLLAMNEAARQQGLNLLFSSAYRSYDYQEEVYRRNVKALGQEAADRESAQPGKSQHQLGTAIDFGSITDAFAETPEGKWLFQHAWEFGFSLSYPEGYEDITGYRYESWHYRYITRPAARLEKEFFLGIQQYMLEFLDAKRNILESRRLRLSR